MGNDRECDCIQRVMKERESVFPSTSSCETALAGFSQLAQTRFTSLSHTQARLVAIESTKSVLLDRLEGLTGQPQGGVWDTKPPPTPPDLHLPGPRPQGLKGEEFRAT